MLAFLEDSLTVTGGNAGPLIPALDLDFAPLVLQGKVDDSVLRRIFEVLPETLWVTCSNLPRVQVESTAEKTARRLEMILVAVPARLSLDAHDLAVQSFGDAVGDPLTAIAINICTYLPSRVCP
jgi:hypothetical protein